MKVSKPDPESTPNRSTLSGITSNDADEIDLRGLLLVLWRRKLAITGTVAVLTVLALVVLYQITPRYSSTALVLLDSREKQIVDIQSVVSGLPADQESISSEIEILRSQGLAEKTIRKLEIYKNPEFNTLLRPATFMQSLGSGVSAIVGFFMGSGDEQPAPLELQFDKERVAIINAFRKNLEVKRRGESRVISITFESNSPQTAFLVANTLAELYLVEQLEARFETTKRASSWLSERLGDLREQVEQSESAVEDFRRQAGLIEGEHMSLTAQQISELNTQLILARGARAEAEARLRQVTALLESSDSVDSVAEVLSSPLIQSLREQEAEVDRRIAELSNEYGDKHPRMINVRAEMADLRSKITGEVNKIVQNLRNEVSVARAREASLKASLDGLEQRMGDLNTSEIQLRALQREAEANRELYGTFLARFKETSTQEEMQHNEARIISRAELPSRPSYPNKPLVILLAIGGALVLGVILAFALEQLVPGFLSLEQIEDTLGVRALGLVPSISRRKGTPEGHAVLNPLSELNEAIRTIYTALSLSHAGQPPKVLLVTSAYPKEGKTTISVLFGRILAMLGKRVLIIDADLRRAEVHSRLGLAATPGLVELLSREASLGDVVQIDKASGLCVVPVGRTGPNASELLSSERLREILDRASAEYDLVIVDSPPSMAVADARMLAHMADVTIFVTRWAVTRREVVALALRQIREAGGTIGGVVLSRVDVRKHSTYGYGDSGAYHGALQKYYRG